MANRNLFYILLSLIPIGFFVYYMFFSTTSGSNTAVISNANNDKTFIPNYVSDNQLGGRRKKSMNKKSKKPVFTTGRIYLLLGAIIVVYITSKIL